MKHITLSQICSLALSITSIFVIVKKLKTSFVKEILVSVFNTLTIALTAQNCNRGEVV